MAGAGGGGDCGVNMIEAGAMPRTGGSPQNVGFCSQAASHTE